MNEILKYTETVYKVGVVFGLSKNYNADGGLKNQKKIVKLDGEDSFNMYFKDKAFMAGRAVCDIEEVVVLQREISKFEDEKSGKIITKKSGYKTNELLSKSATLRAKSQLSNSKPVQEKPVVNNEVEELKRQIAQLTKAFEASQPKANLDDAEIVADSLDSKLPDLGAEAPIKRTRQRRK